jgi:PKD repeat protein
MRDAVNPACAIILNPALVITQPAVLSATLARTNVTCFGAADGTITISGAAGGYGTYEYTINGGATWQASGNFISLNPGFYNVKIRDAAYPSCIITLNASLNITEPSVLSANVARTNVTCNGANDGTITITNPLGGYGTYEYSINGGGAWLASGTFTNLAPATYNVQIRDAANPTCIIILNGALVITEPAPLSATLLSTDVSCFGANNGIITITNPAGGYGTYEYTINGGTTWSSLGNFTSLAPGTFDVRIRDAAHTACTLILNAALVITQPAVLNAVIASTNVTCFGGGDGTITITNPTGGYGTYEYTVNGGGAWQASGSFTGLGPGTYNVQIRDAAHAGCIIVLNNALVITQPAILKATVTPSMVTCNGANDGIIAITAPSGGFGTYEYSINGGSTWQASGTFNGLAPANYDVRIRDAAHTGCEIILNPGLTITEPAVLSAVVSSTDVTCFGANNGVISITNPLGGYGTFEYSNNGGTTWQLTGNFSALAPGSYDVRIRDRAHPTCVIILNPALVITQPNALSAFLQSVDVTCNGANDGIITITNPLGGYGTYAYTINGGASWQTTGTFNNLAPGTYNVRIRDAAHITCEIVLNPALVITQPTKLAATVGSTNVTCFGANDGTITITLPTGGYGTYEYSIDGGASWQASGNFTALDPGFYNVQIRDAAHPACIVTLSGSLRITEPAALGASLQSVNVTCNGANDGRITISSPTGGYGTYGYSITGGASWQATGNFTGLAPGSYNVQIRDAAHTGCIIVLNPALVITEPAVLTATITPVNVTCFGANNGIITITGAAGGYGTYEYTINGGTNWSGLNNFTNLAPGTYDVRIRDAAQTGCAVTLNPALIITQPAVLHADVAKTNVSCYGGSDGTITITNPTGGYGTYEYSVNGGGSWQASGTFTALVPGNYNVRIRDAANITCVIVLNNALQITQPAILNAVETPTMVTCNGANDGIITITTPTGGYGTYEYSIDGGATWSGSGTFTNLQPATFDVRIRDASHTGCFIVLNPQLTITEPTVLNAVVTSVNVTCFGANNGVISITSPTGGYGTYEYSNNGGATWQTSGTFSSLIPGSYDVRIRDRAHIGCVIILNPALVITEPPVLSATITPTMVTCNGANDGIITITNPLGGDGSYQYTINGGATWQASGTFNFLAPGTYNVRIRDAAHITCEIVLDPALVITQPAKLAATVASTNVNCFGANDGTITITSPTGGYGTYEYSVDGGTTWQASGNFTALAPGFYNIQIRDAAHPTCIVILNGSLRITEPPVLTANVNRANVTCNGANDGTITITSPMGGYGTYGYSITGGASWQASGSFTALAPGSYNVQIRDAAHTGCIIILNPALVITEPAILNATVTPVNVSCFGANDGLISVSGATGGYGTYQYSVNGGTTWQGFGNFANLAPGTYDVRIRDAANISCVVTLNPALVITQPAVLAANISSTNVTCFGGNDGTITISGATGGYGTYEFSINGGGSWQASGSFAGLTPGSYNILIRDAAHTGCIIVLNNAYIITQPGMLSATITKTDVSCRGNNNGTITISSPTGGYGTYEYSINGGISWQVSGNFVNLVPGTYDIRIRDAANVACSVILYPNLVITEPLALSMSSTGNVVLDCFGDMDAMGTFYASGGTMPYTFLVVSNTTGGTIAAPGFNSQTFFNAGAGSITVSVVDFNGCSAQATINITQPAVLNPGTISADQVVCYGDNPAMLTESSTPNGGPGAYKFQWQSSTNITGPFINIAGATLSQYTPSAGAAYTLYYRRMVTSGTCMPVYSNVVEILVNPRPVAFLTGGETICPGQSSVIRVNILAGTGPFTVEIANHGIVNGYVSGADIVVTPAATTTYSLKRVRDANNCEVVSPSPNLNGTATVVVSALPSIVSFTPSPAVCEFTLAKFSVAVSGTNPTYQWYVNEGSGFNPVADGGTYFGAMTPTLQIFNTVRTMNGYVYHVVVSGCGTSVTSPDAVFTVNTAPEITLHPKDSTICLGNNAIMEANAVGTNVTWQWYVNKGSGFVLSVDDANFSGSTTRTLTITNAQVAFNNWVFRAIATGTCGAPVNTNFAVLRVINPPVVTLQPAPKTICENGSISFLGNGTGYNSLQWQLFSGGVWTNLTDNATYIGTNTQQLAILNAPVSMNGNQYRLALISICTATYSNAATLTVNANPVVDFSAVDPIAACGGVPIVINGNPTGGSGVYTQHRWTGDVGPLNNYFVQSPTFNSLITGTYNLNYRVTDSKGCIANDDVSVIVDSPSAQFTQDADYGCTPLPVTFTKDMTGISKWWWDFGDGSPLDSLNANPVHNFVNNVAGSIEYFNVKLRVRSTGGCFADFTSTITVYPEVDATFTPNVPIICSGNSITFTALSGATRYFWEYGDGASGYATNISAHLYTNLTTAPVVHTVKLTTTSFYNCVDVKTFDITVMPVPIPQFTAVPLTQVFNAAGNPVTFTNTTNPGTWNWLWKFGDNATSTVMNPVHSYTNVGTYSITLIASNANCSDSVRHSVSVVPPAPVASFDSIPSGCSPLYVNINNTSLNTNVPGTTYQWDFGDGSHSTAKNPTYTYFTPGTYRIELVVTGPGGTSMKSRVVNAYASPKAYFEVTPPQVYVNDERVRCFNLSQGAESYLWDFGDGDTSKVKEPYHRYMEEGEFDITLWAYSANGCSDMYKLAPAITVLPVGELRFSSVFTPNKTGPIELSDLPTGGIEVDQFFFPPIRQKVLKYKLQIFNRWGVLIFQSDNINIPWNGYYKGKLCQQGVYVWYVEGKFADGKPFKMVGNVTLLQ